MPKRKADQSIDESLRESTTVLGASQIEAKANCNQEVIQTLLTAEGTPTDKATDPYTELFGKSQHHHKIISIVLSTLVDYGRLEW